MIITLKDKISSALLSVKENTKDSLLWSDQRSSKIIPNYGKNDCRSDEEILMDRYNEALRELKQAQHNFNAADHNYIEVAVMELKCKELMYDAILREIKDKKIAV